MKKIRYRKKQEEQEQLAALQLLIAMMESDSDISDDFVDDSECEDESDYESECEFCGDVHDLENCDNCGISICSDSHFPTYCLMYDCMRVPRPGHGHPIISASLMTLEPFINYEHCDK